jgi:hypothetical protein
MAWSTSPRSTTMHVVAAGVAVMVAYVGWVGLDPYTPELIDAPWLIGVARRVHVRRLAGLLALASLAMLYLRPRLASVLFVVVAVPWLCWRTAWQIDAELGVRRIADPFDRAGAAAKQLLAPEQIADLRVVVDDPAGASRVLFQLDDARATGLMLQPGETVTPAAWPRSIEWLLVVGEHPIAEPDVERRDFGAFVLAHRVAARREDADAK